MQLLESFVHQGLPEARRELDGRKISTVAHVLNLTLHIWHGPRQSFGSCINRLEVDSEFVMSGWWFRDNERGLNPLGVSGFLNKPVLLEFEDDALHERSHFWRMSALFCMYRSSVVSELELHWFDFGRRTQTKPQAEIIVKFMEESLKISETIGKYSVFDCSV